MRGLLLRSCQKGRRPGGATPDSGVSMASGEITDTRGGVEMSGKTWLTVGLSVLLGSGIAGAMPGNAGAESVTARGGTTGHGAQVQAARWGDENGEQGEVESPRWGDQNGEQGEVESPRWGGQSGEQGEGESPRRGDSGGGKPGPGS